MHRSLIHIVAITIFTTGCTAEWVIPEDYYVECESDADCPDTADCMLTDDGTARVCVTAGRAECGNGVQEAGEECDDGDNNTTEYGLRGRCNLKCDDYAPHCGDGTQDGIEACDAGADNTDAYGAAAGCNSECTGLAPHCGDRIINGGETCDDGADNSDEYGGVGACNASCSGYASYCGDGFADTEETCDDGEANTDAHGSPGRCNSACSGEAPSCGDGIQNGGEACDSGVDNTDAYGDAGRCNGTCNGDAPYCGDALVNGGEVCDTGSANNTDTYGSGGRCNALCNGDAPSCGDAVLNGNESCDDGVDNTDEYGVSGRCNSACNGVAPSCGDGIQNSGESCDSGANNTQEYGSAGRCNSNCTGDAPNCGDGLVNGGESCDLGVANSNAYGAPAGCQVDCSGPPAFCGDALTNGDELCDDGNTQDGDYCSSNCQNVTSVCGDGLVGADEVCDDGLTNANGYQLNQRCLTDCSGYGSHCGDGLIDATEVCDDGNRIDNGNGCSPDCTKCSSVDECSVSGVVACGDSQVHIAIEECDDGNAQTEACAYGEPLCYVCNAVCSFQPIVGAYCGDGDVQQDGREILEVAQVTDSESPYLSNSDEQWVITGPPGTLSLRVHFSSFHTEESYDFVYLGEQVYHGDLGAFTSTEVLGSEVVVRLTSDSSANYSGFTIDYVEATIDTLQWEGCDSNQVVSCTSLHPSLGSGTASCQVNHPTDSQLNCVGYDLSGCSNQDIVYVPAGPFMMGCNSAIDGDCGVNESLYHQVYLDAFVLDKKEVIVADFTDCVNSGSCSYTYTTDSFYRNYDNGRDDHPMNFVNWGDANAFCQAQGKRLPTEAEWEKAARGTDGRMFPWGTELPTCFRAVLNGWHYDPSDSEANSFGWIKGYGCGKNRTWEVGSMEDGRSPYGALDMAGNVWEFVWDWYAEDYYSQTPVGGWNNPEGPSSGSLRVTRGGSFFFTTDGSRTSYRLNPEPDVRYRDFGFRCAH